MLNRTARRRFALSLSALLLTSFVPALPFAAAQQTPPPAQPQSPADKAAADELDQIRKEGVIAFGKNDFSAALKSFQTGLDKAQALNNEKYAALFLNSIGVVYSEIGQNEKALECYQGALPLFEKSGNPKGIATSLDNIGIIYNALGQNDKALEYHQKALPLREKIGDPVDIATSLNNIGAVYSDLGQNEKALEYFKRALTLREKIGNIKGIAASLNNVGAVYSEIGQNEKALEYYQKAFPLFEKIGNPIDIATNLSNIGNVYSNLGQNEKALNYQQRALPLREKIGNTQDIAQSLNNIGLVFSSLDQHEKALECYQRALTLEEKIGTPKEIAASLNNIGLVFSSLDQNEKALECYQRALTLEEKSGNPVGIATSLNNIGIVYFDLGQNEKALEYYQRALPLREEIGNKKYIATTLANIGIVYAGMNQWNKAEATYSQSQMAFETLTKQVADPTELADLQQTLPHFYEKYANVLAQEKRPDAALSLLEAGRARGIARQLFLNRSGFSKTLTPEESAALKQDLSEMNAYNNMLHTAEQQLAACPKNQRDFFQRSKDEYANKARDAERKYDTYNAELFKRYPQFRNESGEIVVTPKDLRSLAAANPDTLFVTWAFLSEKQTSLYALGKQEKETIQNFTLPMGEKKLGTMASEWRDTMTLDRNSLEAQTASHTAKEARQAKSLYAELLGPLAKVGLLAKGRYKRLVLVPSGPLLELPFAALMDASGKRLIENYAVSSKVAFGASFWRSNPAPAKVPMLCITDPIGKAPTKEEQVASRRAGFGPLPGARQEGEAVAGLFHTAALVGPQAKKADVLKAMPGAKLLHFATHSYLNAKSPFYSGLVLAPEPAGSSDDGVLSAREILNMSLTAKLAVLSACETGRGVAKGGDGLQGLVWAFQAAGCPCVVGSQWQVDDEATRELMLAFYKNLLMPGTRKDDALRGAMLAVKKTNPSPYYWAAFEVIGDTSPLVSGKQQAH